MNKRMLVALVALAGVFVALYLTLYKLGYIGTLACAVGSCETVQTSKWATFLGVPVGAWGVGYYVVVLALGLVGLTPRYADTRRLSEILVLLTGFGLLFSIWLTYLELFVIHAICQWCVISAILATILFIVSLLDLRELTRLVEETAEEAAERLRGGAFGAGIRNTSEVAMRAIRKE
ncbi:MAG: vitamin K epoxide reductase family protein [Gemmatimonadetes bacterium]|nr:vitamin K epoxide reductase family protein [Gemmatimonadota bacterium]